ncbi:hypothetical protein LZ023_40725 (plasmid) [Pseudomonas silvicola]|nr:hypothetical protein LZ023_41000 [Pseudomonas silvicola]WAH62260.1 hypothetical protein LZ023_40725 [Pseudomonas silvicola]
MRLRTLKDLFTEGVLTGATVEQCCDGGWTLIVTKQSGDQVAVTLAAEGAKKVYVRLNAALMDAHRIGFRSIEIRLPQEFEREDAPRSGTLR